MARPKYSAELRNGSRAFTGYMWAFYGLFVVLTAAVAYTAVRAARRERARTVTETLSAAARLQAELVSRHMDEHKRDALLLALRPAIWGSLSTRGPRMPEVQGTHALAMTIAQVRSVYRYKHVVIVNLSGDVVAPDAVPRSVRTRRSYARAVRTRQPQVLPFRLGDDGTIEYGVAAPVFADGDTTRAVVGVVALVQEVGKELLPVLPSEQIGIDSAETVLLQQEGDTATVVASTRAGGLAGPLGTRLSIADDRYIAAPIVRASTRVANGLDYRGRAVVAVGARIAGTPWLLIAKVDQAELAAELRSATLAVLALSGLALFLAGAVFWLVWLATVRRAERAQYALASEYIASIASSIDGFVRMRRDGRLLDVNPSLERMTGYSRDELLARSLADLKVGMPVEEIGGWLEHLFDRASARFESHWRTKRGAVISVDVSTSRIEVGNEPQLACILRDVTEQRANSARIEQLNVLYRFLHSAEQALYTTHSVQEAYEAVCRIAVDVGDFPLVWVGTPDTANGQVRVAACAGPEWKYTEGLNLSLDADRDEPRAPTARCLRQARAVIVNDILADAALSPWHKRVEAHQLAAIACVPVVVEHGTTAGVMFYSRTAGYFSDDRADLLGEIARVLGLVVDRLAADEQRRAEQARRESSESRFRELFDFSPLPMCVFDARTSAMVRVNRAYERVIGHAIADTPDIAAFFAAVFPGAAYRAQLTALFWEHVGQLGDPGVNERSSPEVRLHCADGSDRIMQGSTTRVGDELLIAWTDLTTLRERETLLAEADQSARLGRWTYDYATGTVTTSPDFLVALGYDESVRTLGADPDVPWLLNLLHPSEVERVRALIPRGVGADETVRARPVDGRERYLRVRVRVEHDDRGRPLRSTGSFQDISDDVLAARELTRLRDHLQEVVDERTAELARANQALQRTDERLHAVLEISQRAALYSEAEILRFGVSQAARMAGSRFGYLCSVSEDLQRVQYTSWWDELGNAQGAPPSGEHAIQSNPLWVRAIQQGEPALQEASATLALPAPADAAGTKVGRHLVVPIIEGGRVRALLGVAEKSEPYDSSDVQELQLIGRDVFGIAERRRMELALQDAYERLRASEQLFAAAMEASAEGVWEWNVASDLLTYNETYATSFGFTPSELPDSIDGLWQFLHDEDREATKAAFLAAVARDEPFDVEFRVRAKDGSHRWVLSRGRVLKRDAAGNPLRVVGTHTDLTARRQAEEELRAAKEQADEANRAKSAFLAVMSHEIRTPLNGVIAMAEILAQSRLAPHDLEAAQTIQSSASTLLGVIDDILDFSKIEAGRMEIDVADVSLIDLTEELADALLPVARMREVTLELFVSPAIPRLVRCDPTRVRQILYNLLGNAIKFSGGRADVRGRVQVRVDVERASPLVVGIDVTDNGIGMSDETMQRLFLSFTQGEASTTRRYGGSGLGLVICRRLLDLMQGSIRVASTPGLGSTFHIALPVAVADPRGPDFAVSLSGVHAVIIAKPALALPADDIARVLRYGGARVSVVADEADARRIAEEPDGIVVLVHDGRHVAGASWGPGEADVAGVRHVLLTSGWRRTPRVLAPDLVLIDCDLLRPRRIYRAVAVAAGRASPGSEEADRQAPLAPASPVSIDDERARGRLILVAEDDRTNQRVILRQLAILGYAAELAENGAIALEMYRNGRYALVLSDLHMPELDGYSLTQAIRRDEGEGHRLPIIALTANALREEAARAEAAGMDGYLTKPVPLAKLKEWIDRFLPPATSPAPLRDESPSAPAEPPTPTAMADAAPLPVLQVSVLAGLVGDDPAVLREFLGDFRQSATTLRADIHAAHAAGDLATVGALAHRLKSSARSVGALSYGEVCADLEKAGKLAHASSVAGLLVTFDERWRQLEPEIASYLAQH